MKKKHTHTKIYTIWNCFISPPTIPPPKVYFSIFSLTGESLLKCLGMCCHINVNINNATAFHFNIKIVSCQWQTTAFLQKFSILSFLPFPFFFPFISHLSIFAVKQKTLENFSKKKKKRFNFHFAMHVQHSK